MADRTQFPSEDRLPYARLSRRGFLRIVAGAGIAAWVGKSALENLEAAHIVRQTRKLMGTIVYLTLIAHDRKTASAAEDAISACLTRMAELEAVLSRFQADSQVSILNRNGSLKDPHPALLALVLQAQQISELSNGLFDVTILPVLALYQSYQEQKLGVPPPGEIETACRKVNFRKLHTGESEMSFTEPGMGITLDGIAKGYIVNQGVSRLKAYGFPDILVEAGGDLVAGGQSSANRPWKIGVRCPRPSSSPLVAELDVLDEAVATSGDNMQPFTPDYAQHHILNPRTGRSSKALASATVVAPSLTLADALATTLMLMEPAEGMDLIKALGLQAVLVKKDLTLLRI